MDSRSSRMPVLVAVELVMCAAGLILVSHDEAPQPQVPIVKTETATKDVGWLDAFNEPIPQLGSRGHLLAILEKKFLASESEYVRSGIADLEWASTGIVHIKRGRFASFDGKAIDVLLIVTSSGTIPGSVFSMAVLVVDGIVRDFRHR